jgi:hypothetical protein
VPPKKKKKKKKHNIVQTFIFLIHFFKKQFLYYIHETGRYIFGLGMKEKLSIQLIKLSTYQHNSLFYVCKHSSHMFKLITSI